MVDASYSQQITDGLFDPSPQESIFRVKHAVARELGSLDGTAEVKSTEYFNHTFAPDFVLAWPDKSERQVFLRLSYDLEALAEDIGLISTEGPLVMGLTQHDSEPDMAGVATAVESKSAMFTEPDALEKLINRKATDATANMLSNALAQGGVGVFRGEEAVQFAEVVAAGFSGASRLEAVPTSEAAGQIKGKLGDAQAWRMTRVLQAVWEGSDGPLSLFPGDADVSGKLNLDSLRYLLTYMESDDSAFWRRIGRNLALSDLTELDFNSQSHNIQRLIQSNLDVVLARACTVIGNPLEIEGTETDGDFRWGLRKKHLTLEGPGFFAFLGESKSDLQEELQGGRAPLGVSTFVDRAGSSELEEVALRSGKDVLIVRNEDGAIDRDRLTGVAAQFTSSTEVTQAIVRSASGRVTVDFDNASGTGKTRSNILMADLLAEALPLLEAFTDATSTRLAKHLAYTTSAPDPSQVSLFED